MQAARQLPVHNTFGNHCLSLPREYMLKRLGMPASFYAVDLAPGWRLLVLDTTEMSGHSGKSKVRRPLYNLGTKDRPLSQATGLGLQDYYQMAGLLWACCCFAGCGSAMACIHPGLDTLLTHRLCSCSGARTCLYCGQKSQCKIYAAARCKQVQQTEEALLRQVEVEAVLPKQIRWCRQGPTSYGKG